MAIHYDPKAKRFRDDAGRLVSRDRAMRSSVARAEYERAQRKKTAPKKAAPKKTASKKTAPKKTAPKKTAPKKAAPAKAPPKPAKVSRAKLAPELPKKVTRHDPFEDGLPPWEREGVVREYPDDHEWFMNDGYGYDDLMDEWGVFDDEETDS